MNLLILYTKNRQEVFNRKSAIGSYINCLATLIDDKETNVFLNGEKFKNIKEDNKKETIFFKSKFVFFKKYIPKSIKRYIKDAKHFKALVFFENELRHSNQKYDAILEFYNLGSEIGYKVSKAQGIPLHITYDGPIIEEYEFFNNSKPFFLKRIIERQQKSLQQATKIIVYSNPMKKIVKEITGSDSNVFIHQNVDFTRFDVLVDDKDFNNECINICFIGSFLKWHQVDLLVNAFQNIIENDLKAKLFLVGDGQERESIEKNVNNLPIKIKSKIEFTGFLDGHELFELKKQMHVGVMPGSNWYGAPNKIFEYGAMNMAVLAPDTPTIKDLFNNNEITFFKWKNGLDFSDKLEMLVKNKQIHISMADVLNKKIMTKYTVENTKVFYQTILTD